MFRLSFNGKFQKASLYMPEIGFTQTEEDPERLKYGEESSVMQETEIACTYPNIA